MWLLIVHFTLSHFYPFLDYVYDTLAIELEHNFSLPDWTKGYFPGGKFQVRKQKYGVADPGSVPF
jgi:hypothetical protein